MASPSQSPGPAQGADKTSPSCLLFGWGGLPKAFQKQSVLGWGTVPSHTGAYLPSTGSQEPKGLDQHLNQSRSDVAVLQIPRGLKNLPAQDPPQTRAGDSCIIRFPQAALSKPLKLRTLGKGGRLRIFLGPAKHDTWFNVVSSPLKSTVGLGGVIFLRDAPDPSRTAVRVSCAQPNPTHSIRPRSEPSNPGHLG